MSAGTRKQKQADYKLLLVLLVTVSLKLGESLWPQPYSVAREVDQVTQYCTFTESTQEIFFFEPPVEKLNKLEI